MGGSIEAKRSPRKRGNEPQLFEEFWDHVRRAESDIELYGHLGSPPPDDYGDPGDSDFTESYERIKPLLRPKQAKYLFVPPEGLWWRRIPFESKTAHEGLMWFLNPTKEVYGSPGVLQTSEYRALKKAAMEEWRLLKRLRAEAIQRQRIGGPLGTKLYVIWSIIRSHHLPKRGEPTSTPMTHQQISKAASPGGERGWSQPTIFRLMNELFPNGGTAGYRDVCKSGAILRKGFINKLADGSSLVDAAIDEDEEG